MTKSKKILLIVVAVLVFIAACSGIAYAIAPRDFMQLILSDSAYTKVMLAKNLTKTYPEFERIAEKVDEKKLGFEADGSMKIVPEAGALGKGEVTGELSNYLSSLKVNSSVYLNGSLIKATVDIKDNDGSVITAQTVADPMSVYLNINQFGLGWMRLKSDESSAQHDVGTINKTYEKMIEEKADDALRDAVYAAAKTAVAAFDDTLITVGSEKTLSVGSVSATGDVISIIMTKEDFEDCINNTLNQIAQDEKTFNAINDCLPSNEKVAYQEFKTKVSDLKNEMVQKVEESGITNVNLNFYVNKRNDIVGVNIELLSPESNLVLSMVTHDDDDRGMSLNLQKDNDKILSFDLKKNDDKSGNIAVNAVTEDGPFNVNISYSDLEVNDDSIYGHFVTDRFKLPGNDAFGPISLDITVKNAGDTLSLLVKADIKGTGNITATLNARIVDFKEFTVPTIGETSPYDEVKVRSAALEYILKDLPREHASFAKVYNSILSQTIGSAIDNFIGSLTGNDNSGIGGLLGSLIDGDSLSNGISGIVDSALNKDPSQVGGIIDDFFSAFGLK